MKKITHSLLSAGLFALATMSVQAAETSRLFFEQTGNTLATDSVSVDLEYPFSQGAVATGLRAGALGGEVMINTASDDVSGFASSSIGYKRSLQKGLSVYGILSYYDQELPAPGISATDFALGAAYTMKTGELSLNLNPELVTDDANIRGGKNTIFIKGSAALALKNTGTALVAEIILENSSFLDTVINLGARWQPRNNLTVDLIVYNDGGSIGPIPGTRTGIPGYIIVNLLF